MDRPARTDAQRVRGLARASRRGGALPVFIVNEYWRGVLIVSMYFAMLAAGWNLLAGYTGQFSLAPATFGMIGAYTTGLLSYHFGASPPIGIPAAVLVAALIGLALGRIVLRLRGPYLALTTLSFAEILRLVISNSIEITRGDLGLNVPGLIDSRLAWYYFMLAVLAGRAGRALSAVALARRALPARHPRRRDRGREPRRKGRRVEDQRLHPQRRDQRPRRRPLRPFRPTRQPGARADRARPASSSAWW